MFWPNPSFSNIITLSMESVYNCIEKKVSLTNYGGKQGQINFLKVTELTNLENNSCFIF